MVIFIFLNLNVFCTSGLVIKVNDESVPVCQSFCLLEDRKKLFLIKSVIQYAVPIWFPPASASFISKIEIVQNVAIKITTGTLKMTPIHHLHHETDLLPVRNSLPLLSRQYLPGALTPSPPSYPVFNLRGCLWNICKSLHG